MKTSCARNTRVTSLYLSSEGGGCTCKEMWCTSIEMWCEPIHTHAKIHGLKQGISRALVTNRASLLRWGRCYLGLYFRISSPKPIKNCSFNKVQINFVIEDLAC